MSVANEVPETYAREGDDAWETLSSTGRFRLARDAFQRWRSADGSSHSRSLGFLTTLVLMQGIIALVGLASSLAKGGLSDAIVRTLHSAVPGPAGQVLTRAVEQAHQAGSHHSFALWIGLAAAIVTGTTLMGQLERGLNRVYGVEQDRPTLRKYGRAFLLTISSGLLAAVAFSTLAIGHSIASSFSSPTAVTVWNVARWPIGVVLLTGAIGLLFRWSPRRHQPPWPWLTFGALVAVALWTAASILLAVFFNLSSTFGQTYGPLAGIVALMLWSFLVSFAVLYGAAVAAQLEAVRAGAAAPKDPVKVEAADDRVEIVA